MSWELRNENGSRNITLVVSYVPICAHQYTITIKVTIQSVTITDNQTTISLYYIPPSSGQTLGQYKLIVQKRLPGVNQKHLITPIAAGTSGLLLVILAVIGVTTSCVIISKWRRNTDVSPLDSYAPLEQSGTIGGTIVHPLNGESVIIKDQNGML